jgi:hypothetical protein
VDHRPSKSVRRAVASLIRIQTECWSPWCACMPQMRLWLAECFAQSSARRAAVDIKVANENNAAHGVDALETFVG